jgi:hypothetical protein
MNSLLALLSLLCTAGLVVTVSWFVWRIGSAVRSAEASIRHIAALTVAMRRNGAEISPGIGAMNQNLYRVAMHLGQLGEAAEKLVAPSER